VNRFGTEAHQRREFLLYWVDHGKTTIFSAAIALLLR
jgi:hypothetical protein